VQEVGVTRQSDLSQRTDDDDVDVNERWRVFRFIENSMTIVKNKSESGYVEEAVRV
jgi:hypothetical protein